MIKPTLSTIPADLDSGLILPRLSQGLQDLSKLVDAAVREGGSKLHSSGVTWIVTEVLRPSVATRSTFEKLESHVLESMVDVLGGSANLRECNLGYELAFLAREIGSILTGRFVGKEVIVLPKPDTPNTRWFAEKLREVFEDSAVCVQKMEQVVQRIGVRPALPHDESQCIALGLARAAAIVLTREPPEYEAAKTFAELSAQIRPIIPESATTVLTFDASLPPCADAPTAPQLFSQASSGLRRLLHQIPEPSGPDRSAWSNEEQFCSLVRKALTSLLPFVGNPQTADNVFEYDTRGTLLSFFQAPRDYFNTLVFNTDAVKVAFNSLAAKLEDRNAVSYFDFVHALAHPTEGILSSLRTWAAATFSKK